MKTARKIAQETLTRCERSGQYSNLALDATLKRNELNEADRALVTVLVYGVLERRITIDRWIESLAKREVEKIDPEVRDHLRIGLYQLGFLDRIPDHAAVNEAVENAGRRAGGFVNAVMREFIRRGKQLPLPDRETDRTGYFSQRYAVCPELCERLINDMGEQKTKAFLEALESRPPLTLRTNTLKITREELCQALTEAGYAAEKSELAESAVRVTGNANPTSLPGFAEGHFFVQDEASQLAVKALDARPGMTVLDACACPGSKSFGIAIEMQSKGSLTACDLHASKLSLVRTGAERLGISIMEVLERDARTPAPAWEEKFDRILCDVPCSGFGVLGKKPELRAKAPAESAALPDIQLAILTASAPLLKPGGRLVYSTCTVLPAENRNNVERFLARHPQFTCTYDRTLYPDTDRTDGFYIAVLEKAAPTRQKG